MMRLFIFLLFLPSILFAQSINLGLASSIRNSHFDKETNKFYLFKRDTLFVYNLKTFKEERKAIIKTQNDIDLLGVDLITVKNNLFLIDHLGGGVLQVLGDSVKRIDNSFRHKMQIGATLFNYNDIIYRYGGYGFWSVRNFFTYFDVDTKEWDILSPTASEKFPKGSFESIVKIDKDNFYVFGGNSTSAADPKIYIANNEIWKFNFTNKKWEILGDSKIDFSSFTSSMSYGTKHVFFHNKNNLMYVIDVVNGTYRIHKNKNFHFLISIIPHLKSFYHEGIFYFFNNLSKEATIYLTTRNEDEFFGDLIEEGSLYETYDKWILIGLIFVSPILLFLLFTKFKQQLIKKKLINIQNDQLIYKRTIHPFDSKEIQILKLLLKAPDVVQSSEIMDIVENKTLHYAHNIKVKNQIMDNLNFKLKTLLKTDNDIIYTQKSTEDKRIKIYNIDKSYFYIK